MEQWNLHRRIALQIIRFIEEGLSMIILGFMVAGGLLYSAQQTFRRAPAIHLHTR